MSDAIKPTLGPRAAKLWLAGAGYERRRIGELIRQRATLLCEMPGPTPRRAVEELLRLAEVIDKAA